MNAAKQHILDEIKRLTNRANGKPPGEGGFRQATGIERRQWYPNIWLRWGDAVEEAGFTRNVFDNSFTEDLVLERYASLARRLGHLPVEGELVREKKSDATFPNEKAFRRFGSKTKLLSALAVFCRSHSEFSDVLALCETVSSIGKGTNSGGDRKPVQTGFVYLIKSGRHYKIGHTNSVARRTYELGIKIPVPPRTVHYIETDDPVGIEAYWHKRFEAQRGEGEWFNLTPDDVAAFKRWKRIL